MKKIGILLVFFLGSFSCQLMDKDDETKNAGSVTKIESKVKIQDKIKSKTNSAKANWFIAQNGFLRIDVMGPFDILMAQGYRDNKQITLLDHRKKSLFSQSNQKPLILDGFELPLNDLVYLLTSQKPKNWTCETNAFEKFNCKKDKINSSWINANTLVLNYEAYEIEIRFTSEEILTNPNPDIFQFVRPKSYQVVEH